MVSASGPLLGQEETCHGTQVTGDSSPSKPGYHWPPSFSRASGRKGYSTCTRGPLCRVCRDSPCPYPTAGFPLSIEGPMRGHMAVHPVRSPWSQGAPHGPLGHSSPLSHQPRRGRRDMLAVQLRARPSPLALGCCICGEKGMCGTGPGLHVTLSQAGALAWALRRAWRLSEVTDPEPLRGCLDV